MIKWLELISMLRKGYEEANYTSHYVKNPVFRLMGSSLTLYKTLSIGFAHANIEQAHLKRRMI